jgi:3'-phosphoadenosine 5'-phosphosulfate sulfotransferase (PAPS reductase)/FAD synthetase
VIQHLVNCSSGKDSTAVYLLAIESGSEFSAVFADTGNEHPAVYEYIARLPDRTGGPPIRTVRADFTKALARHREYILREWPKQDISDEKVRRAAELNMPTGNVYLDMCIFKGRFPSRMAQFCTEELKTLPITLQVVGPMLKRGPVLQWLGIRADESAKRRKDPRYNRHECGAMIWRPILHWTAQQCFDMHKRHGIEPNPLYAMGFDRVGCFPCINCGKHELRLIAEKFPEHIERIAEWERIVSEANKRNKTTFFPATTDPSAAAAEARGEYAGIHQIAEWAKTTHGGRQYGMFFDKQPGGGCTSDLGVCER